MFTWLAYGNGAVVIHADVVCAETFRARHTVTTLHPAQATVGDQRRESSDVVFGTQNGVAGTVG